MIEQWREASTYAVSDEMNDRYRLGSMRVIQRSHFVKATVGAVVRQLELVLEDRASGYVMMLVR